MLSRTVSRTLSDSQRSRYSPTVMLHLPGRTRGSSAWPTAPVAWCLLFGIRRTDTAPRAAISEASHEFFRTGFSRAAYYLREDKTFTYEDVRHRYGIRVVFDPQNAPTGVALVSTREPMSMWWDGLTGFSGRPSTGYLNRQLEEVRPLLVDDEEGREAGGWFCPSLLAAVHLMRYLDLIARIRMQKCQARGCPEYFRVGPRSRRRLYCPPPPGKKQSKCASRMTSAKYRERQRGRRESDPA